MAETTELDEGRVTKKGATSSVKSLEPAGELPRYVALPNSNRGRNYAEALQGTRGKTFKMTIKSRGAHPPDGIKQILKNKINPGEINVGVNTFKTLSGGVLIETNSKKEIEVLEKEIQTKCGELEVHVHSLRKPRIIILNVPEEISTTNIENTILRQNPELNLQKGSIAAKFTCHKEDAPQRSGGSRGGNQEDST